MSGAGGYCGIKEQCEEVNRSNFRLEMTFYLLLGLSFCTSKISTSSESIVPRL